MESQALEQSGAIEKVPVISPGEILKFNYPGRDVYNPTVPFIYKGERYSVGRVESPRSEQDTKSVYFINQGEAWNPLTDLPEYPLQDPFITKIHDKWILGGVKVDWTSSGKLIDYRTKIMIGDNPFEMEDLIEGPSKMKDIRIVGLINGNIGIYTRPQTGIFGMGKIGFMETANFDSLSTADLSKARLLRDQFGPDAWGGIGAGYLLENGNIGEIGHYAKFVGPRYRHLNPDWPGRKSERDRSYVGFAGETNPETGESADIKIIATRSDFPEAPAKRPDLKDVIFPAGIYERDGHWFLVAGLSDKTIGEVEIPYPFSSPIVNKPVPALLQV